MPSQNITDDWHMSGIWFMKSVRFECDKCAMPRASGHRCSAALGRWSTKRRRLPRTPPLWRYLRVGRCDREAFEQSYRRPFPGVRRRSCPFSSGPGRPSWHGYGFFGPESHISSFYLDHDVNRNPGKFAQILSHILIHWVSLYSNSALL